MKEQELEHAIQGMTEAEIYEFNQKILHDLAVGRAVSDTLNSDGWKNYIKPTIDNLVKALDSVEGITTMEELKARQVSKSALKSFFEAIEVLEGLKDAAEQTIKEQQLEEPEISPTT